MTNNTRRDIILGAGTIALFLNLVLWVFSHERPPIIDTSCRDALEVTLQEYRRSADTLGRCVETLRDCNEWLDGCLRGNE